MLQNNIGSHRTGLAALVLCGLLCVAGCGKEGEDAPGRVENSHEVAHDTNQRSYPALSGRDLIPEHFRGDWYLIVYAGKEDWKFEMGNLEQIHVGEVRIYGPGLKDNPSGYILTHSGSYKNRVWQGRCGSHSVLMKYRNENQIFLDVTDPTEKIIWRGCYLSPSMVNTAGIQNKSMMALAALSACQEYWADFGPTAKEQGAKE